MGGPPASETTEGSFSNLRWLMSGHIPIDSQRAFKTDAKAA